MAQGKPTPPPDIDATLAHLCAPAHVHGALVLTRDGYILRAVGHLFQDPTTTSSSSQAKSTTPTTTTTTTTATEATTTTNESLDNNENKEGNSDDDNAKAPVQTRQQLLTTTYAKHARKVVDSVQNAMDACTLEDSLESSNTNNENKTSPSYLDPLRFLRIRTSRHELLITPDPKYILVVIQDPPR